jgi:benzoate/toluate 1,2-dioxygenase subunit alpha
VLLKSIKGAIQAIRVARPLAVDKTLIESWTLRLVGGAPEELLARTTTYSRLINALTSMVGHDNLHCYCSIQEGLASGVNEWVSLHRNHWPAEADGIAGAFGATNEVPTCGQYRAWEDFMTLAMAEGGA